MESFTEGERDTMEKSKGESCASLPLLLTELAGDLVADLVADRVLIIYYYFDH